MQSKTECAILDLETICGKRMANFYFTFGQTQKNHGGYVKVGNCETGKEAIAIMVENYGRNWALCLNDEEFSQYHIKDLEEIESYNCDEANA